MTIHAAGKQENIYIHSMGKRLRVIAITSSDQEANEYMRKHEEAAVIAQMGPFVFMADKYENGKIDLTEARSAKK